MKWLCRDSVRACEGKNSHPQRTVIAVLFTLVVSFTVGHWQIYTLILGMTNWRFTLEDNHECFIKRMDSYYKQTDFYTINLQTIKNETVLLLRCSTIQVKCLHKLSVSHVPRTHSRTKLKLNFSVWLQLNQQQLRDTNTNWNKPLDISGRNLRKQ